MLLLRRSPVLSAVALALVACANGAELDPGLLATLDTGGTSGTGGPDAGSRAGNGGDSNGAGGSGQGGGAAPAQNGGTPGTGGMLGSGGNAASGAPGSGGSMTTGQGGTLITGGASGSSGKGGSGLAGSGGAMSAGGTVGAGGDCGMNQKRCNDTCVSAVPANGCNSAGCSMCPGPAPDHGLLTCNTQNACDFDCLSGFKRSGTTCVSSNGSGGSGGGSGGSGGSGGMVTCGPLPCLPCPGNNVTCCDKLTGNLCLCALPNLASQLCK
jgi:hypothetical protein